MKTHFAIDPGRPRGPAPGLSLFLRAVRALLLLFVLTGAAGIVRAQTFAPVISQIIPAEDNSTYFDHDGDLPAVIFIKNSGADGTLSSYSLTDTTGTPRKWIFPSNPVITLKAGETIIVFASNKNRLTAPYATNFLLPCASTGYLYNPQSSLASQKTVTGENCPACISVFNANSTAGWIIPTANNPSSTGPDWRTVAFPDTAWPRGQRCLGYDTDPLMANMILYSVFDTGTVDTVNRTITDVSGPTLHTGTWPAPGAAPHIGIPLNTFPKVIENVGFTGPQNPSSYVQYNTHTELDPGTGAYTWAIWVRPMNPDLNGSEVILRKGVDSSTSNAGYAMVRTQAGQLSMQLLAPGTPTTVTVTATTSVAGGALPQNTWTHALATVTRGTASNLTLYVNGVQRAQSAIPAGMNVVTSLPMYLARAVSGGPIMYTGRMDDYVTWNRALSAAEIARVFEAGNAAKRIDDPTAPNSQAPIYTPFIQTDVGTAMKGVNTSLYERLPFTIASPALIQSMTLTMRYDDGFVAYINGVEIARRNAPSGALTFSSAAASDRTDTLALTAEQIPVPAAGISALVAGTNVLAIHALNFQASDQRFLICPDLCYDELTPEDCNITTNGRLFWITFPGNAPEETSNPLRLSVCITGAAGTAGNVSVPGLPTPFSQNFSLPASGKVEINLPKNASLEKSDTIENKGVKITATANVAVVGKTRIDYSTDTFLAHPVRCLGSSYLALCWRNEWILPDLNGSQFGIVAIADNTHVTVNPSVSTGSHAAGVAYNFILNAGQTYMLRNVNNIPADLTGSEITSDSPVAVFGGHRLANVDSTVFFGNTVLEQTLPVALWNFEYAFAPLATRTGELVRVLASENGTTISINGVAQAGTLNKGDKKEYPLAGGGVVTGNRKFLATHLSRSSYADVVANADPFLLNCQPTASWLAGYRFCTPPAAEFPANYANLIARNAELAGVTINPAPLVTGPVTAIPGTPYSYRLLTLAAGTVYSTGGRTHGLEIYGWDEFDAFGHSGGMGFTDTQPPTFTQFLTDFTLFTTFVVGAGERATMPDLRTYFGIHDNCCPDQSLTVIQNPAAGALLAAGDYQGTVTVRDCGENSTTRVFTVHVRTDPRATAFPGQFGNPALEATVWGWRANPDGDMFNNEQEYALGTNMAAPSDPNLAFTFKVTIRQGQEGVEVSYRKRTDDPSLEYSPEGTGELGGWFSGLGHFEETFSGPDALAGFTRIRAFATDSTAFSHFFVRLTIRRN